MRSASALLGWLLLNACTSPPAAVPSCQMLGLDVQAVSAPDRRLLGAASDYPADAMLASHTNELLASQRARRAAAWEVIARVLADVPLAEPTPVTGASVPRFRTWYEADDFRRTFSHAYEALGPAGRAARMPLDEAMLDAAFDANLHTLDGLGWTTQQWDDYVGRLHDGLDVAHVGGVGRIAISPDAARHVARSYPEILRCRRDGAPPAFVDGPPEATQRMAREHVVLDRCTQRVVGPFWVATGGRLEAHLESGAGVENASMRLLAGESASVGVERCVAMGTAPCEATGPGGVIVEITAAGLALDAQLEVTYTAPDVAFASCLEGVFPLGAATVAQEWRRVELGPLPTYDTSAAALAAHLAPGAEGTWGDGVATAEPGSDVIYTQRVAAGSTFRLAGMHIRTREVDHWMNITMWWTDHPDEDFGADRSASVRALGGPWSNYAMCVSIDDVERDPDPRADFADHPTLGASLAAVGSGVGGPSWCSNPYIDGAPGLVRTNCVGCHQHAMSGLLPGEVVMDEMRYPSTGRLFVRDNFPVDGFWGIDAGDDLGVIIEDAVDYWDTAP